MRANLHQPLIYLDHAATTPIRPEVLEAMFPFLSRSFGNPSSIHTLGREAYQALGKARKEVAQDLNCMPDEVVFTSGGTESNNLAVRGVALAKRKLGNHIITSAIEHHAVLNTCRQLEQDYGYEVTYIQVDSNGLISPEDVDHAITSQTVLISIMLANNEVGTIEPVREITRLAHARGIPIHTDAVQAAGMIKLDVEELGVDLLSLTAHKLYGPKGTGILYIRRETPVISQQTGGGQEMKYRAGTENLAGIVGTAAALHLAQAHCLENGIRLEKLRDRLISGVLSHIPRARLTGHPSQRLPNSASFVFPNIPGPEELLLMLDLHGIAASSGSACTARSLEPSHVLTALGILPDLAAGSLRLTLGQENREQDIDRVLETLFEIILDLQGLAVGYHSPGTIGQNR